MRMIVEDAASFYNGREVEVVREPNARCTVTVRIVGTNVEFVTSLWRLVPA